MNFVISILLKLAFTVVKDVFYDVNFVKCKNLSPQSESKDKNN